MRPAFWIACIACLILISLPALSTTFGADGTKAWTAGKDTTKPGSPAVVKAGDRPDGRLGLLERRRLGLTIGKVRPIVERLSSEGKIDKDNPSAAAALVMHELMEQDPQAWGQAEMDWDAILAFLEKLIPLIITLINLFSGGLATPGTAYAIGLVLAFPGARPRRQAA